MKPISKHQQQKQADKKAFPLYSKRRDIDRLKEQRALAASLREVYDL